MKKLYFLGAFLIATFSFAQNNDAMVVQEIPFNMLEEIPTIPGCETNDKDCFNSKVKEIVSENFNTDVADGLTGRQKVMVQFKIDASGNITAVTARAAVEALENEAKRVIALLPQMTPGLVNGKEVDVLYSLPIIFEVKPKKANSLNLQQPSRTVNN